MQYLSNFPCPALTAAIAVLAAGCAQVERPVAAVHEEVVPIAESSSSPGTKYALLPTAVQRTITAQAGASELKDINKVLGVSPDIYEIQFRGYPTLYVADDGTLLGGKPHGAMGAPGVPAGVINGGTSAGIGLSSMPFPVQKYLQEYAPGAAIIDIQKRATTIYDIFFKDSRLNPPLHITEDGTFIKEPVTPTP